MLLCSQRVAPHETLKPVQPFLQDLELETLLCGVRTRERFGVESVEGAEEARARSRLRGDDILGFVRPSLHTREPVLQPVRWHCLQSLIAELHSLNAPVVQACF